MENPETALPPLNQFDKRNTSNYTELINDVILWGLVLSSNFRSYQDFQKKEIILAHNHGIPIETDGEWSAYYFLQRDSSLFSLFCQLKFYTNNRTITAFSEIIGISF